MQVFQKSTKIYYEQLEKLLNFNILLNLIIHKILDLNVVTTNFETFQPSFETFLSDTLE